MSISYVTLYNDGLFSFFFTGKDNGWVSCKLIIKKLPDKWSMVFLMYVVEIKGVGHFLYFPSPFNSLVLVQSPIRVKK